MQLTAKLFVAIILPLCVIPQLIIFRIQLVNLLLHQRYDLPLLTDLIFVLGLLFVSLCNLSSQLLKFVFGIFLRLIVSNRRLGVLSAIQDVRYLGLMATMVILK